MTHSTVRQAFVVRSAVAAGCFLFLSALSAQTPAYFPLETGNTWLYRAVRIDSSRLGALDFTYQTIRVQGTEKIGEREYFDVSYFGRDVALRVEPSTGDVLAYDQAAGMERPWVSLNLPVGGTFPTSIHPCSTEAQVVSRNGMVAVADGDFPDVVEVKFQGSCADAGLTRQYYGPNVRLLIDEETSTSGPITYRLIYYRVGNSSGVEPKEVSFTMAADSPWYFPDGFLSAQLTLRNRGKDAIALHFPSGQSYDLKILNDRSETVYVWSTGRVFDISLRDEKVTSGEISYGISASLKGLPPGRYIAQGYLTTDPAVYFGQVAFEIVGLPGVSLTKSGGSRK